MNAKETNVANLLTAAQAAEVIGCTTGRLYQMIRAGKVPGIVPLGPRMNLIPRKVAEKLRDTPAKTGRPRAASGKYA